LVSKRQIKKLMQQLQPDDDVEFILFWKEFDVIKRYDTGETFTDEEFQEYKKQHEVISLKWNP